MRTPRVRLAPLIHALLFLSAATWSAIVPLLPRLSHVYALPPTGSAILLAAPGVATLAVSVPAGLFTDRLGARRVTLAATLLLIVGVAAQALPSYYPLVAGRMIFGVAFGVLWTTGVAWLAAAPGETGSSHLGSTATSAAAGMTAGPALGGIVADQFGLAAPFLLVAGVAVGLGALLWRQPPVSRVSATARDSMRQLAHVAPRQPGVLSGACVLAIGGAVGGVSQLLIPLALHQSGFSATATGVAFSAAAGVYIVVSAVVVRLGSRATTLRTAGLAGLALALSLLPAALAGGTLVLLVVLVLSTAPRAIVSTVAYPLATGSGAEAGVGEGVVIGLLNGTWAIGLVLAPLLAGMVDQLAGSTAAYLATVVPAALGALWLLARPETRPVRLRAALGRA